MKSDGQTTKNVLYYMLIIIQQLEGPIKEFCSLSSTKSNFNNQKKES